MKISSKSILSPCRARDAPVSLSASLSRRLRTNGSLRGGQSPMFPTGGKKRGCAFENPEPSSPKVTCIGQVRVRTKKQGKKMRTLEKRRGGEVSFRRVEQTREGVTLQSHTQNYQANPNNPQQQKECLSHRNQRWVHLSFTICEALKAFGAEFSCLFPCRSSCFSTGERKKDEKATGSNEGTRQNSCGAVVARWLVALQDGEGGKGREIELVVAEEESTETRERTLRRHAVEEIELKNEKCEVKDGVVGEEEARVSICIPPKNALLLMRCRSDPMRMSALANRFSDSPGPKGEEEEDEDDHEKEEEDGEEGHEDVDGEVLKGDSRLMEDKENEVSEKLVSTKANEEQRNPEAEANVVMEVQEAEGKENPEEKKLDINDELTEEEENQEPEVQEAKQTVAAEENELNGSSSEDVVDPENLENEDALFIQEREEEEEEEEEERRASHHSSSAVFVHPKFADKEIEAEASAEEATLEAAAEEKSIGEKETQETPLKEEVETATQERSESEQPQEEEGMESEEREIEGAMKLERESSSVSPDCLLLMSCEPKLSMEVSKETWVCSTDFVRWLPERQVNTKDGGDEPKKRISTECNPAPPPHTAHNQLLQQPPRSSCSLPAAALSAETMIEQKLVNAVAYERLVLTRCKSEPMRTAAAAAKLAPETCFWKNRKLEPHRRATLGTAGLGF